MSWKSLSYHHIFCKKFENITCLGYARCNSSFRYTDDVKIFRYNELRRSQLLVDTVDCSCSNIFLQHTITFDETLSLFSREKLVWQWNQRFSYTISCLVVNCEVLCMNRVFHVLICYHHQKLHEEKIFSLFLFQSLCENQKSNQIFRPDNLNFPD